MNLLKLLLLAAILFVASGCVPKGRYVWDNYDNKLYQYYKNPVDYDQFVENLKEVIAEGEQAGKVPPGLYAEYGFALYEKGNFPEAGRYFQKENDKWPESRVLMAKMIQNARQRDKKTGQAPAAAAALAAGTAPEAKEAGK